MNLYPDYGKVQPEYVAAMTEAFEFFTDAVQDRLLSPTSGLPSTFRYLPVVADVLTAGRAIAALLYVPPPPKPPVVDNVVSLEQRKRILDGFAIYAKLWFCFRWSPTLW